MFFLEYQSIIINCLYLVCNSRPLLTHGMSKVVMSMMILVLGMLTPTMDVMPYITTEIAHTTCSHCRSDTLSRCQIRYIIVLRAGITGRMIVASHSRHFLSLCVLPLILFVWFSSPLKQKLYPLLLIAVKLSRSEVWLLLEVLFVFWKFERLDWVDKGQRFLQLRKGITRDALKFLFEMCSNWRWRGFAFLLWKPVRPA